MVRFESARATIAYQYKEYLHSNMVRFKLKQTDIVIHYLIFNLHSSMVRFESNSIVFTLLFPFHLHSSMVRFESKKHIWAAVHKIHLHSSMVRFESCI